MLIMWRFGGVGFWLILWCAFGVFMVWTLFGGLSLYGGQRRGGVLSLWCELFGVVCLYVVDVVGGGLCLYMVDSEEVERLVVCLFCCSLVFWWWCLLVYVGAGVFMWWTLFVL